MPNDKEHTVRFFGQISGKWVSGLVSLGKDGVQAILLTDQSSKKKKKAYSQ